MKGKLFSVKMRASKEDLHVSGAEAIVEKEFLERTLLSFFKRAMEHKRGEPDFISLKVELLKKGPFKAPLLPVFHTTGKSEELLLKLFSLAGIPSELGLYAYRLLLKGPSPKGDVMRGALILEVPSGRRLEPDKEKGVRASFLGITPHAEAELKKKAGEFYTERLRDALVLTTKVNSYPGVLGELCLSDDPDYTTGYFSIPKLGYFRLFNLKPSGHPKGGRVIFVKEGLEVESFVNFLKKEPFLGVKFPGYLFWGLPENFRR
ncbi:6-carboxyhexanoate--CoA ligase [Thermovibrio sp.]